jgi:hypothetical protein
MARSEISLLYCLQVEYRDKNICTYLPDKGHLLHTLQGFHVMSNKSQIKLLYVPLSKPLHYKANLLHLFTFVNHNSELSYEFHFSCILSTSFHHVFMYFEILFTLLLII